MYMVKIVSDNWIYLHVVIETVAHKGTHIEKNIFVLLRILKQSKFDFFSFKHVV